MIRNAEYKVRLACHPQDPGMPRGKGFEGVDTVEFAFALGYIKALIAAVSAET